MKLQAVLMVTCILALVLGFQLPSHAGSWDDDFDDGSIDPSLWEVGGSNDIGFGGLYSFSHQEVTDTDGYLELRIDGPATSGTYGAFVWARTTYDYNDNMDHIVNFRWEADVNADHINGYMISFTDGTAPTPDYSDWHGDMWQTDSAANTRLYWTMASSYLQSPHNLAQADFGPADWSIAIDSDTDTATLYQGADLSGSVYGTASLDPNESWYLRFFHVDGSSAGFPGTENYMKVYSFDSQAIPEPTLLTLVGLTGLIALRRRR